MKSSNQNPLKLASLFICLTKDGYAVEVYPNAFNGDDTFGPDRYIVRVLKGFDLLGEWEKPSVIAGLAELQNWYDRRKRGEQEKPI